MILNTVIKAVSVGALSGFLLLNTGCEQQDDLSLASAQACLDTASTASQANTCVAKIAGMESADAYLVRCSANFIAQGFTGQRVATAYARMSSNTSGTDPMLNIMGYLVFANTDSINNVAAAVNNCAKSGVLSMQQLVQVANLATTTVSLVSNLCAPASDLSCVDPSKVDATQLMTKMKSAITQLSTSATTPQLTAIGNVAANVNASFCAAGSNYTTEDVCVYMRQAMSANTAGTADGLATQLLNILKSKSI